MVVNGKPQKIDYSRRSKPLGRIPTRWRTLASIHTRRTARGQTYGKKQIYARTRDLDCTGINQSRHNHSRLYRKHNVHSQTFHNLKQRFMESGKAGLSQSRKKYPIKTMKKREDCYKRLIGELAIAMTF